MNTKDPAGQLYWTADKLEVDRELPRGDLLPLKCCQQMPASILLRLLSKNGYPRYFIFLCSLWDSRFYTTLLSIYTNISDIYIFSPISPNYNFDYRGLATYTLRAARAHWCQFQPTASFNGFLQEGIPRTKYYLLRIILISWVFTEYSSVLCLLPVVL